MPDELEELARRVDRQAERLDRLEQRTKHLREHSEGDTIRCHGCNTDVELTAEDRCPRCGSTVYEGEAW